MKIIMVEWLDSNFDGGWHVKSCIGEMCPVKCATTGILIKETDKYVTIGQSINATQIADCTSIPKGCIIRIRQLGVKNGSH